MASHAIAFKSMGAWSFIDGRRKIGPGA
jgi:hypothetical protein